MIQDIEQGLVMSLECFNRSDVSLHFMKGALVTGAEVTGLSEGSYS